MIKCFTFENFKSFEKAELNMDNDSDLLYEIKIGVNSQLAIDEEGVYLVKTNTLGPKKNKLFKTKTAELEQTEITVQYKNGKKGNDPEAVCVRSSAILPQMIGKMARDTAEEREIVNMLERVISHLRNIRILTPVPSEIRNYARISDVDLRMNCDNISAVLNKMCKDTDSRKRLLEFVRELPENDVTDIEFIETKIGDVIFALKEKNSSSANLVDSRQLSDGTLRCIAVLTAVLISEPGSMVVIEEIDNGIHPARVYKLIEQLIQIGVSRQIDIVVTTHNATLMNSYKRDELTGVSVVYRKKDRGTSQITSFVDMDNFPSVLAAGGLGNAMIDESLLAILKEEPRKKNFSWLGV